MRAGLVVGAELDRERARLLARELRRERALAVAGRALRRRDRSVRELADRLDRFGVGEEARTDALRTLEGAGLVDDARYARARADELARRGRGDAAIRWDLERRGLSREVVEAALAGLEPEHERAARLELAATALARRGFSDDVVASASGLGVGYED